jgi:hypothetical protein
MTHWGSHLINRIMKTICRQPSLESQGISGLKL